MAKKVKVTLTINIEAGKANPAPPVGTVLGPHGVNLVEFCNSYNAQTKDKTGIIPALITIYQDRTLSFILKTPPTSSLIKKALNLKKGSGVPHKEKVGKITRAQVKEIAEIKLPDLNAYDIDAAMRIIEGTARQMGVDVIEG